MLLYITFSHLALLFEISVTFGASGRKLILRTTPSPSNTSLVIDHGLVAEHAKRVVVKRSRRGNSDEVVAGLDPHQVAAPGIYSIPEPPANEGNKGDGNSFFWDWTIFYCSIIIASSSLITFCLVKNCLCDGLADDCQKIPCCNSCCCCC